MQYNIVYDQDAVNPSTDHDRWGYLIVTNGKYSNLADETYKYGYYSLLVSLAGEYQNLDTDRIYRALNLSDDRHHYGMHGLDLIVAQADSRAMIEAVFDKYFVSVSADHIEPGSLYYIRVEDILKEYGRKKMSKQLRKRAESVLHSELEEFYAYLEGEVYGWEVVDEEGECVDSCYGYYGETGRKYAEEDARHTIKQLTTEGVC